MLTAERGMPLHDKFGRAITDLRISITDRCNYKCVYCRTGNEGALYGDLPFDDYLRMARVLVGMGITKVRLTGGEPLLRKGVVEFVRELAQLRRQGLKPSSQNGPERSAKAALFHGSRAALYHGSAHAGSDNSEPLDIALTTNGHMLAEMAQPLKDAGLSRVTVSMDAVDPDRFARITRVPNGYDHVLAGIRAARRAGLWPLKVNCVLMRGFNEDQIIPFGMFAREEGVTVRFIEFMPLEEGRTWAPSTVVTLDEILARMAEYRPLVEIPHARSETARRYRFEDGVGEIGIIAPVSHQMHLVLTNVARTKALRRAVEVSREILHRVNVATDSAWGIVATLEFIQHQLPKMGHSKPPCDPSLTPSTMPGDDPCRSVRRASDLVQTPMWEVKSEP